MLADFLRDLDDPRRAVEIDAARRRHRAHDRSAGSATPTGYTGLEGLLNYAYYQAGAINQFDSVGHSCTSRSTTSSAGPCGEFTTRPRSRRRASPASRPGGGTHHQTSLDAATAASAWLGPNQPGITAEDLGLAAATTRRSARTAPSPARPPASSAIRAGPSATVLGAADGGGGNGRPDGAAAPAAPASAAPRSGPAGDDSGAAGPPGGQGLPDDLEDILDLPPGRSTTCRRTSRTASTPCGNGGTRQRRRQRWRQRRRWRRQRWRRRRWRQRHGHASERPPRLPAWGR